MMSFFRQVGHALKSSTLYAQPFHNLRLTRFASTVISPKLFVSGLSRQTSDVKLEEAFAPFGELVEAKVVVDKATGRSRGFAFVTYKTIEEAEKAREAMDSKFLDGWVIFVDPARETVRRPPVVPETESTSGFKIIKTVGWCG